MDLSLSLELEGLKQSEDELLKRVVSTRSSLDPASVPNVLILGEDEEGNRAGLVWVVRSKDENSGIDRAFILDLHVEESFRGRGLGSVLMDKAEEWGRSNGLGSIGLAVSERNVAAIHLYEGRGYSTQRRMMVKPL